MDPIACVRRACEAIADRDLDEAQEAAHDLRDWIRKGGFSCGNDALATVARAIDMLGRRLWIEKRLPQTVGHGRRARMIESRDGLDREIAEDIRDLIRFCGTDPEVRVPWFRTDLTVFQNLNEC